MVKYKEGLRMHQYRIGDLSNIFGLSSEMIRYYEKQGVISPQRDAENGYRIYTSFDVFNLLEAIQYKSMDIQLNEIEKMKSEDFMAEYTARLKKYRQARFDELNYNLLLIGRLDGMIHRNECIRHNLGNYWIAHTEACYRFRMCESANDHYSRIMTSRKVLQKLFNSPLRQFFDSAVEFCGEKEVWYFSVDEKIAKALDIPLDEAEFCNGHNELYTVIDMGKIGTFSQDCLKPVYAYLDEKDYLLSGPIRGIICGRGMDKMEYHRYIELHIPIKL